MEENDPSFQEYSINIWKSNFLLILKFLWIFSLICYSLLSKLLLKIKKTDFFCSK